MATPSLGTYLHRLKLAMAAEALADCSDRELVDRLRSDQDDGAFRAILERHGPMVYQVCRRVLSSQADVEDAFQATFLVLVRRGHTIRRRASLASWLHGVAHRTAIKLRTQAGRRRRREEKVARGDAAVLRDDTTWGELRAILDEELGALPDACRAPLVLCYLEGRTQDEAAAQLDVSKSTLRRHLERGRELLGRRLARRGVTLAAALAAPLVSDCVHGAALPRTLLVRTTASASHTPGLAAPAGVLSARVAALTDGVSKTMQFAKYKTMVAMLACSLALGLGIQIGPRFASAQDKNPGRDAKPPATAPDVDPIDPNLVFDPEVQKQLRLSPNQINKLTEARDRGREAMSDQGKRVAEIDQRIKKLQEEIDRLNQERNTAQQAIHKSEAERVKAAIPGLLSREAVRELQQMTLQRMRLPDVLLDAKVRARLELNDEQIKKIQELAEKAAVTWVLGDGSVVSGRVRFAQTVNHASTLRVLYATADFDDTSRSELLKLLTPQQRSALERMSGIALEKQK
jgi:RNA polymerase sigma factor (sigma-70 family)